MSIKVLVVDDTIFYRKIVSDILKSLPAVEVAGTANNGEIAMARIKTLKPDLVTLDVEMPVMNGLEVLQAIKRGGLDVDVLMLSSKTERGSLITMEALELGAFDFITKPDEATPAANIAVLEKQLKRVIAIFSERLALKQRMGGRAPAGKVMGVAAPALLKPAVRPALRPVPRHEKSQAVAIGISTGGPNALARMLPGLPANLGVPVFLVQHMPPLFTASLAKSLDAKCPLHVKEAVNGEAVCVNTVYIAPGGRQMKVASGAGLEKIIRITDDPPENNCRPSVDYLFRSVAREYGSKSTCVVMTGMGTDGRLGLTVTKASGAFAIAQDEASCVVYGMPKAVIDAGLAHVVAPLEAIAGEILKSL